MNEEEREESSEDFEDSRARAKRSKALGGTSSAAAAAARNAHQSLIGTINFLCCLVTIVLMLNLNLRIYRFLGFVFSIIGESTVDIMVLYSEILLC